MKTLFLSLFIGIASYAQTAVDLGKQSKNVNFSNAPSTTPWKMGTTLPGTCNTGEVFFNTAASNGLNINLCINNVWVAFTGALGSIPVQSGSAGFYLRTNGTSLNWSNIITGASGAIDCATIPGVCDISTALIPFKMVANTWTGANDFSSSPALKLRRGNGDPGGGCSLSTDVGSVYVRADGAADNNLWICENNGGTRRWRRQTDGVIQSAIQTVNQGHFWMGQDAGTGSSGTLGVREPRCWEFTNPATITQLGKASTLLDTVDAAGFASLAIYAADNTLAGQSNTVATTTPGLMSFTFSPALTLNSGVYTACLAATSSTVVFRASSITSGGTLLLRSLATPRLFTPANSATGTNPLVMPSTLGTRTALGASLFPVAVVAEP